MRGVMNEENKPAIALFGLQFMYAGLALFTRTALIHGVSPRIFVLYRHAIATLVIVPVAYFSRRKSGRPPMTLKSFCLVFLTAFFGITLNQNMYSQGMYLATASMATAMSNLVPAVTFAMATIFGLEKIDLQSLRSLAKIVGTLVCVGGAICMALLRGPKLLNADELLIMPLFNSENKDWVLGCLYLFGSCLSWSIWLILQVPASKSYPDALTLTAWMCFLATLQSAAVTLIIEQDPNAWVLHSTLEFGCVLYSGVFGSAMAFFVQNWCISKRGPVFSAMFSPLCTVIATILAAFFLHEEIYSGSLVGAIAVITGLYIVLWGKANDSRNLTEDMTLKLPAEQNAVVQVIVDGSIKNSDQENYLKEPLLADKLVDVNERDKI